MNGFHCVFSSIVCTEKLCVLIGMQFLIRKKKKNESKCISTFFGHLVRKWKMHRDYNLPAGFLHYIGPSVTGHLAKCIIAIDDWIIDNLSICQQERTIRCKNKRRKQLHMNINLVLKGAASFEWIMKCSSIRQNIVAYEPWIANHLGKQKWWIHRKNNL